MTLKLPPLLLTFLAALLMALLAGGLPDSTIPGALPMALILMGILVCALAVVDFRRARTTVDPRHPEAASQLVVVGIYRWSRNPMYLGFLLALAGWGIYLGKMLALVVLPAFVIYLNRFQIRPEEQALAARFGDAYLDYRQRVRRWL